MGEFAALKDRGTPPVKVSGPDPTYTPEARARRVQGTMKAQCRIMTNGCAVGCRIVKTLPFMNEAVLDALQRTHYRPATVDGKPVNVDYSVTVTLSLP